MYKALIFLAIVASAFTLGFGLGAPLLSRAISYQPTEHNHVRPKVTVQQPDYRTSIKSVHVPVPVAQPYYTAPVGHKKNIAQPQIVSAPYPGLSFGSGASIGY